MLACVSVYHMYVLPRVQKAVSATWMLEIKLNSLEAVPLGEPFPQALFLRGKKKSHYIGLVGLLTLEC